jgi:small-conductance mechanosensitive channel
MSALSNFLIIFLTYIGILLVIAPVFFFLNKKKDLSSSRYRILLAFILFIVLSLLIIFSHVLMATVFPSVSQIVRDNILTAIYTMWWIILAYNLDVWLGFFVWDGIFSLNGVRMVPRVLTGMISGILYLIIIALMMRIVYGKSVTALLAASGVVAFGLAYSMRASIGEIFQGIIVALSGNIRRGDYVQVDNVRGTIAEINWRSIKILDENMMTNIFPNSVFSNKIVQNFSHPTKEYRARTSVVVDIKHDILEVKKIITQAVGDPLCVNLVGSEVRIGKIEANRVTYKVKVFVTIPEFKAVDAMLSSIKQHFTRHGISYTADQLNDEARYVPQEKEKENEDYEAIKVFLKKNSVLSHLVEEELDQLSHHLRKRDYCFPERIIIQNEKKHSLFYIESGEVLTYSTQADGSELEMRTLKAGEVFALKSCLLGEARRISARAKEKAVLYEIEQSAMKKLFKERPKIVEKFSEILSLRESENVDKSQKTDAEKKAHEEEMKSAKMRFMKQLNKLLKD